MEQDGQLAGGQIRGHVDLEAVKLMVAHRARLLDAMRAGLGQRRYVKPTSAPGPNRRADR